MLMKLAVTLTALILTNLTGEAHAADPIFGKEIRLQGYSAGGNGCPSGSVSVIMSPDGSEFSVLYDKLTVGVGPGKPTAYASCEVDISLSKPFMMGFRIESADFRGFVSLAPGVVAEQRVKLSSGLVKEIRNATADFGAQRWYGPTQENYILSTVHPTSQLDVLSCVPLNKKTHIIIKTEIRMQQNRNPNGTGLLAVDSTDGKLIQRYHVRWENCARDIGSIIGGLFGR